MASKSEALEFLTDIPLFSKLKRDEARLIASSAARKALPARELLCVEGWEASFFAIMVSGRAKAVLAEGKGREVLLDFYYPGDSIGEMNVSELVHYPFNLVTLEASEFILIARPAMIELMKRNGDVAYQLAGTTARRLLDLHRRVRSLALDQGARRITSYFQHLGRRFGRQASDELIIDLPLSHQAIADACGFTRETVSRLLLELNARGELIKGDDGWRLVLT